MTEETKKKALVFLLLALIVVVLIAAGLPRLELNPGIPLPNMGGNEGATAADTSPVVSITVSTLFKAIFGVVLTVIIAFLLFRILRKARWKDVLVRLVLALAAIIVGLFILFSLFKVRINLGSSGEDTLPPELPVFGPPLGTPPPFLLWLIILGLVVLAILLTVWVIRWKTKQGDASDDLMAEAERALIALRMGKDFKNVIVECYWQMSQVLQKEHAIQRSQAMTAREFERLLEQRGLPHAPVHQLTQLFEAARYGIQAPEPQDEQTAIECLTAIIQSSRSLEEAS